MKNLINRQKYKDIKRFDHQQMKTFARNLYEEGIKKGVEAAAGQKREVDLAKMEQEILDIKGIGKIKAEQIMQIVRAFLQTQPKEEHYERNN